MFIFAFVFVFVFVFAFIFAFAYFINYFYFLCLKIVSYYLLLIRMLKIINKTIPMQQKELHNGTREYKMYLDIAIETKTEYKKNKSKSNEYIYYLREQKMIQKINKRASQLLFRLHEGCGKALYMIGIKDDGTVEGIDIELIFSSINFLYKMVHIINAVIKSIRIYKGSKNNKYICTARIEIPKYKENELPIM